MIELAQHYRGWTQREAAAALGRNVHAIIPDSGNPKLDMVVSLSEILDWPVEMVVADLRGKMDAPGDPGEHNDGPTLGDSEAKAIVRRAWELVGEERWNDVIEHSVPEQHLRLDGDSFAHLMYYRQVAFECDGRYLEAADCCRRGIRRAARGSEASYRLRATLAYALFMTGQTCEAGAVALEVAGELRDAPRESSLRTLFALASYVRGLVLRLDSETAGLHGPRLLNESRSWLREAAEVFADGPSPSRSPKDALFGQSARAATDEVRVALGEMPPEAFVAEVLQRLDELPSIADIDCWEAEAIGWRCVLGARTVTRHLASFDDAERILAILTNKVDEVAERLGHWALRQHLFMIEHIYRVLAGREGQRPVEWNLDESDVRTLMGTMGRFPEFREIGWQILKAVQAERKERSR